MAIVNLMVTKKQNKQKQPWIGCSHCHTAHDWGWVLSMPLGALVISGVKFNSRLKYFKETTPRPLACRSRCLGVRTVQLYSTIVQGYAETDSAASGFAIGQRKAIGSSVYALSRFTKSHESTDKKRKWNVLDLFCFFWPTFTRRSAFCQVCHLMAF